MPSLAARTPPHAAPLRVVPPSLYVYPLASGVRGAAEDAGELGIDYALACAAAAVDAACQHLPEQATEAALWRTHRARLLAGIRSAAAGAGAELRVLLSEQLYAIAADADSASARLRRLLFCALHVHNLLDTCEDPRLPAGVRAHARSSGFRLLDQIARVERDLEVADLAARRNAIFVDLGIQPRALALLDWCDVAVRIATGGPLRAALAVLPAATAEALLAAKVRFDLLAVELNIALDDVADELRDPGLFALAVERVFGVAVFAAETPVGRFFRGHLARARAQHRRAPVAAWSRYIALIEELHAAVVAAGQALAGARWDARCWQAQMQRILGAMMLSLVENASPELIDGVDWSTDFFGPDRLAVEGSNGNRVVFEIVGQWAYENALGRRLDAAASVRLEGAAEDLQVAQQIGNCIATLAREIDEGDRSNLALARAAACWAGMSPAERRLLVHTADLHAALGCLGVSVADDRLIETLIDRVRAAEARPQHALAATCLRRLVEQSGVLEALLSQWRVCVGRAAEALAQAGFCGETCWRAQADLLLLHLQVLRKNTASDLSGRQ